jgi:hypothetical protein
MYKRIQSIRVICFSLFLLVGYTNCLQLTTRDVYEAEVRVFITIIPGLNSPGQNIDVCLRLLIDELT